MAVVGAVDMMPVVRPAPRALAVAVSRDRPYWDRGPLVWLVHAIAVVALSYGLFAVCLDLFKQNNHFVTYYHPDERSKGEQLAANDRNFNHPQLMLETALLLMPQTKSDIESRQQSPDSVIVRPPMEGDVNAIVIEGRGVSAAFCAAAAVLLAWAGWAAAGWIGFLGVGLAVGLCPALLSHAHYFKEDAALMFGIAVTLCSGAWALRLRSAGGKTWALIGLGVGAGLSVSGKYCGAVMLIPAVLIALPALRRHWAMLPAGPLIVIAFAVVTAAGVNYRIFSDFEHFTQNLGRETEHSTTEHNGLTMNRPNTFFSDAVWTEAMPHIKLLAIAALPALAWQVWRRRRFGFGVWLILTIGIYLAMLSYSVIPFYRYAMPATVMLYALAGLSLAWLAAIPRQWWTRLLITSVGLAVIGVAQWKRCADYNNQYGDDSRDALREWAATGLPPGATCMVDTYAASVLNDSPARIVQVMSNGNTVRGSVEDMRAQGVQYVITASSTSDRFLDPHVIPSVGNEDDMGRMSNFYRQLKQYPIVWQRVAEHPMWTFANPDLRVYRIEKPA